MASPRNLKLRAVLVPFQTVQQVPNLKTTALTNVHETYGRNLNRVYALTIFAPAMVKIADTLASFATRVRFENELRTDAERLDAKALSAELDKRITANAEKRRQIIKKKDDAARKLIQDEVTFGLDAMESFLKNDVSQAADAWLSALITGTWTAFEAMAEELWVTALNLHPRGLAELKGTKKGGGDDKKVDLYLLQKYGYDLSSKMGYVLRKRFSFDKLEEIRQAYLDAFAEDQDVIKAVIEDRALDALAQTRHVIIHNAGVIDPEFLKYKAYLPPDIIGNVSETLPLDGAITAALITPVMQLGWNLIAAVDGWIARH